MNHPPDAPSPNSRGIPWGWSAGIILAAVAGVGYVVVAPVLEHEASHRMPRNEAAAVAALKTLTRVEMFLKSQNSAGLYHTGDICLMCRPEISWAPEDPVVVESLAEADRFPDRSTGRALPRPGPPVARHGYFFEALVSDEDGKPYAAVAADRDGKPRLNAKKFGFRATPEIHGKTGRMTFQVNQEGTVYSKDLGHGAEADPPRASWEGGVDPIKDGWKAVD